MNSLRLSLCLLFVAVGTASSAQSVTVAKGEGDAKPRQPQISIDDDARIYIAFGRANEIFVTRSNDGQRFSPQVSVAQLPKLALGMRRGPRIATIHDSVVVAAISHEAGNLFAWHSDDRGESWSDGVVVNSVPNSAREGLHAIASGPDGSVYLVWLDLRSGSTEIYLSQSTDAGASWSKNTRVYRSPSGTVCECCHPSVAVGADGRVFVMWRNVVDGDRDMYLAFSDDGQNFGSAQKLGSGSWPLDACPMDGGDLAVDRDGKVRTVWRRRNTIYVSSLDKPFEKPVGKGEQPWIENSDDGTWMLWLTQRGGELRAVRPDGKAEQLADRASDPVVESGGDKPIVVAAWEEQTDVESRIVARVLSD